MPTATPGTPATITFPIAVAPLTGQRQPKLFSPTIAVEPQGAQSAQRKTMLSANQSVAWLRCWGWRRVGLSGGGARGCECRGVGTSPQKVT